MAVGLGVGLAVGAGYRPTPAAAQAAAAVAATARVLPAVGALPSAPPLLRPASGAIRPSWHREPDHADGPALPAFPATTVTRHVQGHRRVVVLAATGV